MAPPCHHHHLVHLFKVKTLNNILIQGPEQLIDFVIPDAQFYISEYVTSPHEAETWVNSVLIVLNHTSV